MNIKNSKIIICPGSELYSLVQKLAFCVFYYLNWYQWDILCHMSDLLQSSCSLLTVLQDHIKFIYENVLYVEVMYYFT